MPGTRQVGGFDIVRLLYLVLLLAVVLTPMLFSRSPEPPARPDSDGDDGRGKRPPQPPRPPGPPSGNVPLSDAAQARTRLRGHTRLADRHRPPSRRPARHPDRRRVRTGR